MNQGSNTYMDKKYRFSIIATFDQGTLLVDFKTHYELNFSTFNAFLKKRVSPMFRQNIKEVFFEELVEDLEFLFDLMDFFEIPKIQPEIIGTIKVI